MIIVFVKRRRLRWPISNYSPIKTIKSFSWNFNKNFVENIHITLKKCQEIQLSQYNAVIWACKVKMSVEFSRTVGAAQSHNSFLIESDQSISPNLNKNFVENIHISLKYVLKIPNLDMMRWFGLVKCQLVLDFHESSARLILINTFWFDQINQFRRI